jgi:predicted DNA-binding transcriptional regulator AlpA
MSAGLTTAQLLQLPAVIDLVTAGRALGTGRSKSYELAQTGKFPCRVIRVGHNYRVPTAELLHILGMQPSTLS